MHKAAPCSMSEILCNRHHLENYVILYVAVLYSSLFLRKKRIWKKKKKKDTPVTDSNAGQKH